MPKNFTIFVFLFVFIFSLNLFSQVPIFTGNLITIDFTGYSGTGFTPGGGAGMLNSEWLRLTGMSDGDLAFDGIATTGDFARGTSTGGVTTGGFYAFDIGGGDIAFGIQPGGTDFTPGEVILRLQNLTGTTLNQLNIQYNIYVLNDQARANSLNFSYSEDDITYTPIASLDFISDEAADAIPVWNSVTRATSITGLNVANGNNFYVKWTGDDYSGSLNRDEFAVDNILISEGDTPLPVELTSFTANAGNNRVTLNWNTASESENMGYAIMRGMEKDGNYEELDSYVNNNSLKGAGNSSTSLNYKFVDNAVMNDITYWYKLIDVDYNGVRTEHGPIHATPRADEVEVNPVDGNIPLVFGLAQNFPNPFNPSTTISFDIPKLNDGIMNAQLIVYDMLGQKVKTLLNSTVEAGHFEMNWDGRNDMNQVVPSGIYIYQFQSELFNASKKMVLLR